MISIMENAGSPRPRANKLKPGMCNFSVHMPSLGRHIIGRSAVLTGATSSGRHFLVCDVEGLERIHPAAGRAREHK